MSETLRNVAAQGAAGALAGCRVTIDLDALVENYRALSSLARPAATAAVVKADAYGLGAAHVVAALAEAGCDHFFVALPEEGVAVRAIAPQARIFVLGGLFGETAAEACVEAGLTPVLNSRQDIALWESHGWRDDQPLACAIHVDTGMNRLGLTPDEARVFAEDNALTRAIAPVLVMSHLACGDESGHPMNRRQLESFQSVRRFFEGIDSSLANSAGILLGRAYHAELVRPGIALYGGAPLSGVDNPMRTVVTAEARIVQLRTVRAGETVSYGATVTAERDTRIAVVSAGYADGYHRAGSGSGVPLRRAASQGAQGFLHGRRVPVIGRVTMDLTMFDVSAIDADEVSAGDHVELFGPNIPLDEAAAAAGTIAYEMLTSLGRRSHRVYLGGGTDG